MKSRVWPLCLVISALVACAAETPRCGPATANVARAIDGDTIELEGGERVRYLMVDTPEISGGACYALEAHTFNSDLVAGKQVSLTYDIDCRDNYDRLLAYVSILDREVNTLLVARGYACVLYISPNGQDRRNEFDTLEAQARAASRGMWAACPGVSCPL